CARYAVVSATRSWKPYEYW
nr:immunoglobulin heavy chain junction region [Macaca mulatta]